MVEGAAPAAPAGAQGRRRNHLAWIGPVVTAVGAVGYFELARFPPLRDVPWLNLPLVLLGTALSVVAVRRAFRRPRAPLGQVLASLGAVFSVLLAAAFCAYVFWFSYTLPEPTVATLALTEAPDFELAASDGSTVRLSDYRGTRVVLVFYRGFW